jgi:RNA polymerase primary sigma factor
LTKTPRRAVNKRPPHDSTPLEADVTDRRQPLFDEVDADFEVEEEIALEEEDDGANNTDDPVRMSLMQMGQIPLLTRQEEVVSAKRIERTRVYFRHTMLANDYVLQGAVELLEQVRDGRLIEERHLLDCWHLK